jgi:amino acid transporter
MTDNALYPILFYDCFMQLLTVTEAPAAVLGTSSSNNNNNNNNNGINMNNIMNDSSNSWHDYYGDPTIRFVFLALLTCLLTLLNLKGLDVVGNVSLVICALSLLPFVVFCIMGAPHVQTDRWFQGRLFIAIYTVDIVVT